MRARVSKNIALRRATAATEFALLLPLLLLIVFGCVDFGRVAYTSVLLNNAVGAGARYSATHRFTDYSESSWESRVRECIVDEMQNTPDFDADSLDIDVQSATDSDSYVMISIQASYPFQTVVNWPALPTSLLLSKQVNVRQYR